jgi:hypothetical protein
MSDYRKMAREARERNKGMSRDVKSTGLVLSTYFSAPDEIPVWFAKADEKGKEYYIDFRLAQISRMIFGLLRTGKGTSVEPSSLRFTRTWGLKDLGSFVLESSRRDAQSVKRGMLCRSLFTKTTH